jgi:short-chain fatty acids transporter
MIAKSINTTAKAIVVVTLVSLTASILNWGLGLVVGGILCREIIKYHPKANFRLMVAAAYSGFIVWHGGLSASIPLALATHGNFSADLLGYTIPISQTIFSPINLTAVIAIFVLLPIANWHMEKTTKAEPFDTQTIGGNEPQKSILPKTENPNQRIENSRLISYSVALLGFVYLYLKVASHEFTLDLNSLNFIFLFVAILLHKTPRALIDAIGDATKTVGPILLQFPFYAGLMGIIMSTDLANIISNAFINFSTEKTFLLNTFYSAGLLNLFIPSGGGQWAVQGPIVLQAAQDMGIDIAKVATAVAWGDAWTNLLQPFWALPILAISGLHLRDIMSYCVTILLFTGIILSAIFLVFA